MKTKQKIAAILIVIMATAIALSGMTAILIIQSILATIVVVCGVYIAITGKEIVIRW